jgi:nitrate reductase alpha subunit
VDKRAFLSSLTYFRAAKQKGPCEEESLGGGWTSIRCGDRDWEDLYRRRWQYDKVVRSTHGVNCTGSCSWNVYVKDGIIAWETQKTDYPPVGKDLPSYEPRGCPRGATFSWYVYSPVRIKYPLIRSVLLEMWREALAAHADPVAAWRSIVSDPDKTRRYRQVRGKGGFVRVPWDEAVQLISAALVSTIRDYGPDRIFGFSPIPAMSMVCYASGARFISLIGGSMVSFYDWYSDLPPASPQIWGEQTDVPVSADWYDSTYMIIWGTNIPMTRSPDAHFLTEARYRGAKVAAVAPDYAEYVKFADTWLPARAGTDGALAMAMVFVVLKEFYIDRQSEYFTGYARQFTDLPFLVRLKKSGERYVSDRFLRASDLGLDVQNSEWKTVVYDSNTAELVVPNGSIGFRWGETEHWNLNLRDSMDAEGGKEASPLLSMEGVASEWAEVAFPSFDTSPAGIREGSVPVLRLGEGNDAVQVTTVFDLLAASVGIKRRGQGDAKASYDALDGCTPAWQEAITGVNRKEAIRVAREFAENAEKTHGKSMIFLGAGTNHWYHSDAIYRTIISLTTLCGCQGVNGGGWAHYVGQEKVRPLVGWTTLAFGLDWLRPPRQHNGTSFFYFATDQWRYEALDARTFMSPLAEEGRMIHPADYNITAARLGWLPSYPQFDGNPMSVCEEALAAGAKTDEEIVSFAAEKVRSGELKFAAEDPCGPSNIPRVLFLWRANLLGASGKGHEYFLKHLLGTESSAMGEEKAGRRPREMTYREADPQGKLDLLVTSELRMSTSALYADVVLPAAGWYEMHDLNTTDLHPFIHPFTPAIDPPWEAKTNWDQFKAVAEGFSTLAATHLGKKKDLVATPLMHDTRAEIAQPLGQVRDWRKGEVEAVPGKTMPGLQVVERDFPNAYKMMTSLGPLVADQGIGVKGASWKAAEEYEELKSIAGTVQTDGVSKGRPDITTGRQAAEAILVLSPETNGSVAVKAWAQTEKRTGLNLLHLARDDKGQKYRFADIEARPRKVLTSPVWSGIEAEHRTYSPFVVNIEEKVPFRTLTGRAQFYLDHEWMLGFGEGLPVFRPPLDLNSLGSMEFKHPDRPEQELVLNYLTPHSKWSIHSTYSDTLIMLTLFRGGEAIWISNEDAETIKVIDNDWVECYNANGVVVAKAVVSHRVPKGKAFMYHAQERLINTPGSKLSGKRGGTHNSVTRILMKPTQMIGGYAQLSYGFNYYGPTGAQRDEVILIRKAGEVDWYED